MQSRFVVGAVALGAIVVAAISFAVVDASIAAANGCMDTPGPCEDHTIPIVAITFSALGMLALLISIVPAVTWIVGAIQVHHTTTHHSEIDLELARRHRARRHENDDFDA